MRSPKGTARCDIRTSRRNLTDYQAGGQVLAVGEGAIREQLPTQLAVELLGNDPTRARQSHCHSPASDSTGQTSARTPAVNPPPGKSPRHGVEATHSPQRRSHGVDRPAEGPRSMSITGVTGRTFETLAPGIQQARHTSSSRRPGRRDASGQREPEPGDARDARLDY